MATVPKFVPPVKRVEHFGDQRDNKVETRLSKGKGEEVEFFSKRDLRIVFDFDEGSPFGQGSEFLVKAGQTTPTGPLREEVANGEQYRYRVLQQDTGAGADPTIIIQQ